MKHKTSAQKNDGCFILISTVASQEHVGGCEGTWGLHSPLCLEYKFWN